MQGTEGWSGRDPWRYEPVPRRLRVLELVVDEGDGADEEPEGEANVEDEDDETIEVDESDLLPESVGASAILDEIARIAVGLGADGAPVH